MNRHIWGKADSKDVYLISSSDGNLKADITNYGGAVVSLSVPDKSGELTDVVMGFDTLAEYIDQKYYVGTIIGRCANRIKNARFAIDGQEFLLDQNEGENHLHGGRKGFWNVVWDIGSYGKDYVVLKYFSPHGAGGYPGNLDCTVEYRLTDNQLKICYTGICDRDTIMNLTNHSYFNLNGYGDGTIEDHIVSIAADKFTEIDKECCSTGNILSVEDTPFDLRNPKRIGEMLPEKHDQMEYGSGSNHNYVLNNRENSRMPVVDLFSPKSGIGMNVVTDMEGIHFYTGNYLDGKLYGKNGALYPRFGALCFETQHFPNAVNIEHFPSPVIKKGEKIKSMTAFRFYTK
ncbi:MAG TPA: aldose epimerase family protein [Anaerovoracaceae bacterium]|nr:aldose epimerase family protein [Anaerovoracaceae bacterium]